MTMEPISEIENQSFYLEKEFSDIFFANDFHNCIQENTKSEESHTIPQFQIQIPSLSINSHQPHLHSSLESHKDFCIVDQTGSECILCYPPEQIPQVGQYGSTYLQENKNEHHLTNSKQNVIAFFRPSRSLETNTPDDSMYSTDHNRGTACTFVKTVPRKRKYKADDIRKKIKSRTHKTIKNLINQTLKVAGSNLFFDYLPQAFIGNVKKKDNHVVLNLTLRELLAKDFGGNDADQGKVKKNIQVLSYLDSHPAIRKKSKFEFISHFKYADLLDEYFHSKELLKDVKKLRDEGEDEEYVGKYIYLAMNWVKFYQEEGSSS